MIDLIAAKWTVPTYLALHDAAGAVRFAVLQRRLAPITPKELAKQLRSLERRGIVHRRVHPTVPPSVDYTLTSLGLSMHATLEGLATWAAAHGDILRPDRCDIARPDEDRPPAALSR